MTFEMQINSVDSCDKSKNCTFVLKLQNTYAE